MESIYRFLEVDTSFASSMLEERINVDRIPKNIWIEKCMQRIAETLRNAGLDKMVHTVRQSGFPDMVRNCNTKQEGKKKEENMYNRAELVRYFSEDVQNLSIMLGRDLIKEWNIQT